MAIERKTWAFGNACLVLLNVRRSTILEAERAPLDSHDRWGRCRDSCMDLDSVRFGIKSTVENHWCQSVSLNAVRSRQAIRSASGRASGQHHRSVSSVKNCADGRTAERSIRYVPVNVAIVEAFVFATIAGRLFAPIPITLKLVSSCVARGNCFYSLLRSDHDRLQYNAAS